MLGPVIIQQAITRCYHHEQTNACVPATEVLRPHLQSFLGFVVVALDLTLCKREEQTIYDDVRAPAASRVQSDYAITSCTAI